MLVDMNAAPLLVGVGEHDLAAPVGVRVVGQFMKINTEALVQLRPTHVLAMYGAGGAPQHLVDLAASQRFELIVYGFPNRVEDVLRIIHQPPDAEQPNDMGEAPALSAALGQDDTGQRLWLKMREQLLGIQTLTRPRTRPFVLMVFGLSPIIASGPKTVLHDLLETYVGGTNAARDSAMGAPTFDREKLLKLRPQVILLLLPNAPPLSDLDNDPRLAALADMPIAAVQNGRVVLINDPLALLPSSSLPRLAAAMAAAVHPQLADEIEKLMQAH